MALCRAPPPPGLTVDAPVMLLSLLPVSANFFDPKQIKSYFRDLKKMSQVDGEIWSLKRETLKRH